jgi:aminopeptidase-like protein
MQYALYVDSHFRKLKKGHYRVSVRYCQISRAIVPAEYLTRSNIFYRIDPVFYYSNVCHPSYRTKLAA